MKKIFNISGMHCNSCISKIKSALEEVEEVVNADVTLTPPKVVIEISSEVTFNKLQSALQKVGDYKLEKSKNIEKTVRSIKNDENTSLYPLFLIIAYIMGVVFCIALSSNNFTIAWVLRQFMAGFFITFSFFKLLDIKGFVLAFSGYDLIAKHFKPYGWIYPFLELALGILFLSEKLLTIASLVTIFIMGVGAIGVIRVLFKKNKIQCACLGTVLNLPMTKITLIENSLMVIMALIMILGIL